MLESFFRNRTTFTSRLSMILVCMISVAVLIAASWCLANTIVEAFEPKVAVASEKAQLSNDAASGVAADNTNTHKFLFSITRHFAALAKIQ